MPHLELKTTHKAVRDYYGAIEQLSLLHAHHEGAVRPAFGALLQYCAKQFRWTLVGEYEVRRPKRRPLRVDGALRDSWSLTHGYWEAKDEDDNLEVEVKKKIDAGYPTDNIIFQAPERAILYQNGKQVLDVSLKQPEALVEVLTEFFRYEPPHYDDWQRAVTEFKGKVPELGRALIEIIEKERKANRKFVDAFTKFAQVCRASINPRLPDEAVEKMLVQHMLTERIFRKVFDNPDFARRNVIASEIEQVVSALTSRAFNRDKFLGNLDRFYGAIESTAGSITEFTEKQGFLNSVYENFFQGFDEKTADTHGIVYTPQSIVRFMVRSVDEILKKEFGRSLGDKDVHILDPFVGTGNFILHVMQHIPRSQLPHKYANELHANEVMLLPYYIASMNIEHEYAELAGEYKPFEGLCLVDTFELAEAKQRSLFTQENAARVERQKKAPITVVIGNPPYNAWQVDENQGAKNRRYSSIEERVRSTYAAESGASNTSSLGDPYVKAFRWASDRLGEDGILAFVSNNSYVEQIAFDGMRKHLTRDFDALYVLNLGGNVRQNPKLSGTTHNVFGIQVGVSVGFFVRRKKTKRPRNAKLFYARTGEDWRREKKYLFLDDTKSLGAIGWEKIAPDENGTWIRNGFHEEYRTFMPLSAERLTGDGEHQSIFALASNGLKSNADAYVFGFDRNALIVRAKEMVSAYCAERLRWLASSPPKDIATFIRVNEKVLKWSQTTRAALGRGEDVEFLEKEIVGAIYRPFTRQFLYLSRVFAERVYQLPNLFPNAKSVNRCIAIRDNAGRSAFSVLAVDSIPEQHLCASTDAYQVFPLKKYNGRTQDNITDWSLAEFRKHYSDKKVTKDDIFDYVYGLLHSPEYRTRYEANLKRELPRIPFAPDFWAFASAGKKLAKLHIDYEHQKEWPLQRVETGNTLDLRVEKMKLSKDKTSLRYNGFLTLNGIPPEAQEYRLGNRSALEWIVDQYQVSTDKRSGIVNDPNRLDDPDYIVRLIGQVITVSVETVRIVKALPSIGVEAA